MHSMNRESIAEERWEMTRPRQLRHRISMRTPAGLLQADPWHTAC